MLANSPMTILHIEDDEDDHEFFKNAVKHFVPDVHLEFAANGEEAMKKLKFNAILPGLIVLDLNMPIMNGYNTLAALNSDPSLLSIPIVIFTTSDLQHDRERCLAYGAIDYFVKPTDIKGWTLTAEKIIQYCN